MEEDSKLRKMPEYKDVKVALAQQTILEPEVKQLLTEWTMNQEEKVEKATTKESQLLAWVSFERERAKLYMDGDYKQEAGQALNDALTIAGQENLNILQIEILDDIKNI